MNYCVQVLARRRSFMHENVIFMHENVISMHENVILLYENKKIASAMIFLPQKFSW